VSKRVSPAERLRAEIDEVFAGGEDLSRAIERVARLGAPEFRDALVDIPVQGLTHLEQVGEPRQAVIGRLGGRLPHHQVDRARFRWRRSAALPEVVDDCRPVRKPLGTELDPFTLESIGAVVGPAVDQEVAAVELLVMGEDQPLVGDRILTLPEV